MCNTAAADGILGRRAGGWQAVLLLHGWPDDPSTFDHVLPALVQAGFQTFAPWLRGFGPTRFLSDETMRSGQIVAMAQDVLDFAEAIGIDQFAVIGHDWGARIAYVLASLFPERVTRCVAISVPWQPGPLKTPSFEQARAYWYQWFMATERGEEMVRRNGIEFARSMLEDVEPAGLV